MLPKAYEPQEVKKLADKWQNASAGNRLNLNFGDLMREIESPAFCGAFCICLIANVRF